MIGQVVKFRFGSKQWEVLDTFCDGNDYYLVVAAVGHPRTVTIVEVRYDDVTLVEPEAAGFRG